MDQIRLFAQEVAEREGCRLYDLEFHDGPGRALRVYIDKEPGGVSIADCANVSRGLNLRLDVEDVIPGGRYDLEVSSPGLDRKLTQLWHFAAAIGKTVRLKYKQQDGSSRSVDAELLVVEGSKLSLKGSQGDFAVEFADVQKARIQLPDLVAKKPHPTKKKKR